MEALTDRGLRILAVTAGALGLLGWGQFLWVVRATMFPGGTFRDPASMEAVGLVNCALCTTVPQAGFLVLALTALALARQRQDPRTRFAAAIAVAITASWLLTFGGACLFG